MMINQPAPEKQEQVSTRITPANKTIVLINPRATYCHEIAQKCYPPMNLLYLAAALKAAGFHPVVLDANAFRMTDEAIEREIRELKPLMVGLALYSEILRQVRDLTSLIRRAHPVAKIVLGGPHVNAVPFETMRQYREVDYLLLCEAEASLPQLCRAVSQMQAGNGVALGEDPLQVKDVPGIFYRNGNGVLEGPPAILPDINQVPAPARELVMRAYEEKLYYSIMVRRMPVDTLFTSRGCPFHCGFCYNTRFKYRARAPEDVVHELASIRDRGIRDVEICDDTFTANRNRAIEIFDLIIKEKLDISFRIKSRVDVFTEDLAKKAKQAGVYLVSFGMESGSQRMLDLMQKKTTTELNARACALTRKYHMLSHSSWIIGYPGETRDSVEETLNFILKHKPSTVNMAVLRPYPQTLAYTVAAEQGMLVGEWHPDTDELPWVRLPWAPEKKILDDLCSKIRRRIYFTPHYVASFANQIVRGANMKLAQYAVQESLKVFGLRR